MDNGSAALAFAEKIDSPADVCKRSLALNNSVSEYHPLIVSYVITFDEIIRNMEIFYKLTKTAESESFVLQRLSHHELFVYCCDRGILRWTLGEWMQYYGLRRKINTGMDNKTISRIAEIAPRFVEEINFLIAGLERELRKYRTLN